MRRWPGLALRARRVRRIAFIVCGLVVLLAIAGTTVGAQDQDAEDREEISSLRSEREELAREAAATASSLDALRADDEAVATALADLEEYVALQQSRVAAAEASIAAAEAEANTALLEAEWLSDDIESIRERLNQRTIDVFTEPRSDVVNQLGEADFSETTVKLYLLDQLLGSEVDLQDDLRAAQGQLEAAKRLALERAAAAEAERQALLVRLEELEVAEAEAQRYREEVETRILEWERESNEIAIADEVIAAEIFSLEEGIRNRAEQRRREEEAARRAAVAEERRLAEERDGPFQLVVWPGDGDIVSDFGPRIHPIFGSRRMHNGVDLDGNTGDPIRAARSGTVLIAGWRAGYGNTVVVNHGLGYSTLYGHMSRIHVEVGQEVQSGEVLGDVGSTGWSTGPHLHFELRIDGEAVDPEPYLA